MEKYEYLSCSLSILKSIFKLILLFCNFSLFSKSSFCFLFANLEVNINFEIISLLTGQLTPSYKISKHNEEELQNLLKKGIEKCKELSKILKDHDFEINSPEKWIPKQFDDIIKELTNLLEKNANKDTTIELILNKMKEERSFNNYLNNKDSIFIEAMIQGKWVLLNGIEFAQPELFQKIMSLCDGDKCYLNLFEKGKEFQYSRDSDDEQKKISEDFRLFITYNPFSVETNKRLSPCFLNKCLVFSLFPIEDNILNASLILSNSFIQNEKLKNNYIQLAAILSSIHFKCKELSENESNKMIGKKNMWKNFNFFDKLYK